MKNSKLILVAVLVLFIAQTSFAIESKASNTANAICGISEIDIPINQCLTIAEDSGVTDQYGKAEIGLYGNWGETDSIYVWGEICDGAVTNETNDSITYSTDSGTLTITFLYSVQITLEGALMYTFIYDVAPSDSSGLPIVGASVSADCQDLDGDEIIDDDECGIIITQGGDTLFEVVNSCSSCGDGGNGEEDEEICDGIDNDGDDLVDESPNPFNELPWIKQCNVEGECGAGTQMCLEGEWTPCDNPQPQPETCNDHDDDCDGLIDEDLTRGCGIGIGICVGNETCAVGDWINCDAPLPGEFEEICDDGLDNDCDGSIDEGCGCTPGEQKTCGDNYPCGICKQGTQTCSEDGIWGVCVGEILPTIEICEDGLDNDCDCLIDEGCPCITGSTRLCGSAIGECELGNQICIAGVWGELCNDGVLPVQEICYNGLDDDCDGQIDEGCGLEPISGTGTGETDGLEIQTLDPVAVGEIQTIYVVGSGTEEPVESATITVVTPSGTILTDITDTAGKISFQVAEPGIHEVSAIKDTRSANASFTALDAISSLLASAGSLGDWLFGQAFSDAPWLCILLLVLAIIAAVIAYYVSEDYFSKGAKPFSQRRLEKIARIAIAAIFLILPLVVNLITSVEIAILFTFIEIAALFILEYHKNGWDRIKRIPTVFVAKPTLKTTQPGLVGEIK